MLRAVKHDALLPVLCLVSHGLGSVTVLPGLICLLKLHMLTESPACRNGCNST